MDNFIIYDILDEGIHKNKFFCAFNSNIQKFRNLFNSLASFFFGIK